MWNWLEAYEAALAAGFDPHVWIESHHADAGPRTCMSPTSCPTGTAELDEDGILQCEHHTLLEDEWSAHRNRWVCDLLMDELNRWLGPSKQPVKEDATVSA